jgi:putative transposase
VSKPRPVFKGATFMSTRRVRGRTYLLRPSEHTNNIVGYVLAVQAKSGTCACTPCASWGTITTLFRATPQQGSRVALESDGDIIAQIAYAMANPVEAGLVREGSSWPGLRAAWPHKPMVFTRPTTYFSDAKNSPWPARAELALARPPEHDDTSDEDLRRGTHRP